MSELIFEKRENIGYIALNRPDKFNSVNKQLALDFQAALDVCATDTDIKVVLLTGIGKAFCAGQDLGEIVDPQGPPISEIVSKHFNPIIMKIRSLNKVVVCAVNGVAAGAGANIAIACDITIAQESANFIQAFSKINLIPDSGGTYTLPRLVGLQRATALMMLGDKISAKAAENMGMIYKCVPDEALEAEALNIANTLASLPQAGLALTKQALNSSFTNTMEQQLILEDKLQTIAGNTEDYKECVTAFVEKRKPILKGK